MASASQPSAATADPAAAQRASFEKAWAAARRGDQSVFERERQSLQTYLLYPYLEYNALLSARSTVDPPKMAAFLDQHEDWAFTPAL
ncbi:MAG: hypothetical protein R3212_10150, partial [Xanthomonadales bacterium]|nr:hypothetical protein [Xanthomonadales bacterium]